MELEAGVNVESAFLEAVVLLRRATEDSPEGSEARRVFEVAVAVATDDEASADDRFAAAASPEVRVAFEEALLHDLRTKSAALPVSVDRIRVLVDSWCGIFSRSIGTYKDGDGWHSGTLRIAADDLDRIVGMGLGALYLTPIHPIGSTDRKGHDNTLTVESGDSGSPYAVGSHKDGYDAIHPDPGIFEDFGLPAGEAKKRGMEVALDIALQCSPNHPWLTKHPEWFMTRADGTITYTENPPKKYQDIYPLNFDNDPEGVYREVERVLELRVEHGVTVFHVDNPYTEPVNFWERLFADFRGSHPEVIFLAEAFIQPPMVWGLGTVGLHQSYVYFTQRNERKEIEDYLWELTRVSDDRVHPAFWPTAYDVFMPYMRRGSLTALSIHVMPAATDTPTWGIYSGYGLVENVACPSVEEQTNSKKHEFRAHDYTLGEDSGIPHLLSNLNRIRRDHPAPQRLRGFVINPISNEKILSFTRFARLRKAPNGKFDAVIVVLNFDPYAIRDVLVYPSPMPFGVNPRWDTGPTLRVTDELPGRAFLWSEGLYVSFDPRGQCAHILLVKAI